MSKPIRDALSETEDTYVKVKAKDLADLCVSVGDTKSGSLGAYARNVAKDDPDRQIMVHRDAHLKSLFEKLDKLPTS
jgi:hypothetical protein